MNKVVEELTKELFEAINAEENIHPRRDRVLVRELPTSKSDVVWTPEDKANRGVVIATGPGHYNSQGIRIPTDVDVGDVVMFNKHVGETKEINGQPLRFIKASDILLKIK